MNENGYLTDAYLRFLLSLLGVPPLAERLLQERHQSRRDVVVEMELLKDVAVRAAY